MDARALLEPSAPRFVKQLRNTKSPIAKVAVRQIAALYAIEATVRGAPPQIRLEARTEHSAPIIAALKPWFEKQLSMISSGSSWPPISATRSLLGRPDQVPRGRSPGAGHQPGQNAVGPVALTRKNALFAGHEVGAENSALLASIVATCKLGDVNPVAYIAETLQAIIDGHPRSRIEELMPWNFRKASSQNASGIGKALRSLRNATSSSRTSEARCLWGRRRGKRTAIFSRDALPLHAILKNGCCVSAIFALLAAQIRLRLADEGRASALPAISGRTNGGPCFAKIAPHFCRVARNRFTWPL